MSKLNHLNPDVGITYDNQILNSVKYLVKFRWVKFDVWYKI